MLLRDSDDKTPNGIDGDDHERCDSITSHELACAVHCAVKVRGALNVLAALARLGLGDKAGIQIRVNGELFTGHRVQREARSHFSDASCAVGDDDELDHDEDQEDHEADGVVAADHDLPEEIYDLAGVAVQQDLTRRRDVQR